MTLLTTLFGPVSDQSLVALFWSSLTALTVIGAIAEKSKTEAGMRAILGLLPMLAGGVYAAKHGAAAFASAGLPLLAVVSMLGLSLIVLSSLSQEKRALPYKPGRQKISDFELLDDDGCSALSEDRDHSQILCSSASDCRTRTQVRLLSNEAFTDKTI